HHSRGRLQAHRVLRRQPPGVVQPGQCSGRRAQPGRKPAGIGPKASSAIARLPARNRGANAGAEPEVPAMRCPSERTRRPDPALAATWAKAQATWVYAADDCEIPVPSRIAIATDSTRSASA